MVTEAFRNRVQIVPYRGENAAHMRFSSPAEALSFLADSAPAQIKRVTKCGWEDPAWFGLGKQEMPAFLGSCHAAHALDLFRQANAKLETQASPSSRADFRPNGAAWAPARVVQNHPRAGIIRERSKLPPLNLVVRLGTRGGTAAEKLALPAARIARAAWEYQERGGLVTLTIWGGGRYIWGTNPSTNGFDAKLFTMAVSVPLSSESAIATALSCTFYRAVFLAFAEEIGGEGFASLKLPSPDGAIWLSGDEKETNASLTAAGIK